MNSIEMIKSGLGKAADRLVDLEYSLCAKAVCKKVRCGENLKGHLKDNRGMAVVEIVLIIAVIVGVLFLFREKIGDLVSKIFTDVSGKTDEFMDQPS